MYDTISGPLLRRLYSSQVHPVIIKARPGYFRELWHQVKQLDAFQAVRREYFIHEILPFGYYGPIPRFGMISAVLATHDILHLADSLYVEKIYPDLAMRALITYPTVPQEAVYTYRHLQFTTTKYTKKLIGADVANEKGYTGKDVKVAVPDTGAPVYHEQLGWRYGSFEMKSVMPAQQFDSNGHGTWCITTIGGVPGKDERMTRKTGSEIEAEGIAPDADLLAVKVLGYVIGTGSTSQIIKGLEIAAEWGADVISMSLGGPSQTDSPEDDPFYPVMEKLVNEEQRIVVVAAGNEGPGENTISSPGAMPQVLTVGAYDPIKGELADFSSRGPTNWGDTKPDVVAPGVNILSASVGLLDYAVDKVLDRYGILSGTSMATPHVAGLTTLMRQAHNTLLGNTLTVDEIKQMMQNWADEQGIEKSNDYGWGPITWDVYEWWLSTQYGVNI